MTPPTLTGDQRSIDAEQLRTTELTESECHKVLSVRRRRVVLEVLGEREGALDLDDLAVAVARRETETDDPAQETIDNVVLTLHHKHLPMMDDLGVVEYDSATQAIR